MNMVFCIAMGGAVGSVLRHLAGRAALFLWGGAFPYGTLFVNVTGSFLMGLFIAVFAAQGEHFSPSLRAFLSVGVLGGFTTFSTFSLDVATLYERGAFFYAFFYVALSLLLSLAAIACGLFIGRNMIT